jgi:hypothetical protein
MPSCSMMDDDWNVFGDACLEALRTNEVIEPMKDW